MPGLSLVFRVPGKGLPPRDRWLRALAAAHGDAPSVQTTRFEDACCRIGTDAHERYPIEVREDDRAFCCLEGRVYSRSVQAAAGDLQALAVDLARDPGGGVAAIRSLLAVWEGEYVALAYLKRERRLWIFSDPLGRLPLYALRSEGGLTLSRDQRFVIEHEGSAAVDRLGLAQFLIFSYPLGRRTLIRDVDRVAAGAAFRADPGGIRAIEGLGEPLDYERKDRAGIPAERNAADLVELFTHACRIRTQDDDRPLIALSGGLDSRAVGAGIARAGRPFDCYMFLDHAGVYAHETTVAEEVARVLGAPWRLFETPAPRGTALRRMLEMKTGLNTLAMAYSIEVFERLRGACGARFTYWSGDGGDRVLPDLRPRLSRRGKAGLADFLVDSRPIWSPEMVTRLIGVSGEDLRASVGEVIAAYPERGADQAFVRYQYVERGGRWVFEGEDCNRHYYWTIAPFFDRAFLRAALACPDDQKSGHRLYLRFMRRLHPDLVRIPDAGSGKRMDSPAYWWLRRAREEGRRFPWLRRWLRMHRPASVLQPRAELVSAILRRQLEQSAPVRACFSPQALAAIAAAPGDWGDAALDCLLTATCAVEEIMGGSSTLAEFGAESFG